VRRTQDQHRLLAGEQPVERRERRAEIALLHGPGEVEDPAHAMLAHHRGHLLDAHRNVVRTAGQRGLAKLGQQRHGIVTGPLHQKACGFVGERVALRRRALAEPFSERGALEWGERDDRRRGSRVQQQCALRSRSADSSSSASRRRQVLGAGRWR
jgi:hypothetical protein